ncbi:alkaline phosphatase [Robertkochia marina]|uniref:Alkaline phosphatase n=1 Tax=Robertkochia marina TaxID=1227945 RepID=A0A4S3M1Q8_9FLAO|nr:alkaline phosphatase D family protein [Robertkochia marina]THD68760.1 alkaline phosphatase [Robertkochia marina]TRZ43831.1 alkaline phosphatase [Robertkochia marina]
MSKLRRKFLKDSALFTGGLILMPNLISCEDDEPLEEQLPDEAENSLRRDNFFEGVASFDPSDTQVILWTRYTTSNDSQVTLGWQIANDEGFKDVVRSGEVTTDASYDHTVTLEVRDLPEGTSFFYRFFNLKDGMVSSVGQSLTLPSKNDQTAQVRIAACSCSNYIAGYFNVYEAIANSEADFVLHLGDYIYEYATPSSVDAGLNRNHEPDKELLQLNDYRSRYRQYRKDPQLQELHRRKPFYVVWDDHEVADNAWQSGASAHQQDEGSYEVRKQEAIKAFSEYLPVRTENIAKVYRRVEIGGIADLLLLDTRHAGRDLQLNYRSFLNNDTTVDSEALNNARNAADRTLLGAEQRSWLEGSLGNSTDKWCLIGQQVLMGNMLFPAELLPLVDQGFSEQEASGSISPETLESLEITLRELLEIKLRQQNGDPTLSQEDLERVRDVVPYNLDAWDGYAAEREWLLSRVEAPVVVISGDSHNAWFNELYTLDRTLKGYEVATAGVSSAGFERLLSGTTASAAQFEAALTLLVDDLVYSNISNKGFVLLDCSLSTIQVSWNFVSTITGTAFSVLSDRTEILTR